MNRSRFIVATLVAPVAALIGPALLAIVVAMSERFAEAAPGTDGAFDDAPIRAVGVFLVVGLPVLYLSAAVLYAVVGGILARVGKLTLKASTGLAAAATACILCAVLLLRQLSGSAGGLPSPLAMGVTGMALSFFAAVGAATWWFVAVGKGLSNPSVKRTA
jgi:hypothetical protein